MHASMDYQAKSNGYEVPTSSDFRKTAEDAGFRHVRNNGTWYYGIGLQSEDEVC